MNLTPRQVLAGLFLICGVGLGLSVATSMFKARAQNSPVPPNMEMAAPPPPAENLPPDNLPPANPDPNAFGAPTLPPADMGQTPLEPALRVVNPEGFIYNPEGLRDPFFPVRKGGAKVVESKPDEVKTSQELEYDPREPLQSDRLLDYRLVGVMWDVRDPRALILTPSGRVLAVKKKYRLGREGAVVVAIRESEIVVAEPNPDGTYVNASTRILRMKK